MNPFSGMQLQVNGAPPSVAERKLNAAPASLQFAGSFIANSTVIDYFWVHTFAAYGTDSLRKVTFELQTDSAGAPSGTTLGSYEQVGGFAAKAATKILPSWGSVSLTPGDRYWLVCKNTSAAPTVDYVGLSTSAVLPLAQTQAYNYIVGPYIFRQYNGTNWTTVVLDATAFFMLKYADGNLEGVRYVSSSVYNTNNLVSASASLGCEAQIPLTSASINVAAVALFVTNALDGLSLKIYRNRSAIAVGKYTNSLPVARSGFVSLPVDFTANPGDWIAVMVDFMTGSGIQPYGEMLPQNPDFLQLKTWNSRLVKLTSSGVWSADEYEVPGLRFFLDQNQPFKPTINRRTSTGR